ncbi:MAG TPA: hypothetical protein VF950_03010 [Planctomycetota bacterium]
MICDEILATSDEHVRGCAACRAEQELFERDGRELAAALLRAASPARRFGGWIPFAAAAALLVSLLALAFVPVPPVERAQPADALQFLVSRENALWGQVLAVDDAGRVAVSVGLRDGVQPRQALTLYRRTADGEVEVGTLVVDDVQQAVSAGRLSEKLLDPAAGDFALADRLLDAAEKAAVLDHLFSFRPLADESKVLDALHRLESQDLRDSGRRDLLAGGGATRVVLERLDLPPTLLIRAREALSETDRVDRLVRDAGLQKDVDFLSRLRDPRAYARLKAILGDVLPIFPAPGPGLADRLHEPWMSIQSRVRWNPDRDRYE